MKTLWSLTLQPKLICLTFIMAFSLHGFGESTPDKIKKIRTVEQAQVFIKQNPALGAEIISLNSSSDTSNLHKKLYGRRTGYVLIADDSIYKILYDTAALFLRVSYIYL